MRRFAIFALLALAGGPLAAQQAPARQDSAGTQAAVLGDAAAPVPPQRDPYLSGGPLPAEQAAYDVRFYELALRVNPADSTIEGTLTAHVDLVAPLEWFVLDLDTLLAVRAVRDAGSGAELSVERRVGQLWIRLPRPAAAGERVAVSVDYGGKPRVAPRPPWDGGFTWERTADGQPWIATSNQGEGADIWWPVKDHSSDEPDSMSLRITVPQPLFVASNGKLRSTEENADGTRTFHWFVSTPINNYAVALNIAPYQEIRQEYTSVTGETFPVFFWHLPENAQQARAFFPEILAHLRWFEEQVGPYPFRADKYGVVETPHLGMEHQTVIAYGAKYNNAAMTGFDFGFDALHHHELAHEWWGNLVTHVDVNDMWLHEGFGSYMQALYSGHLNGEDGYRMAMAAARHSIMNQKPVAPREPIHSGEVTSDIYPKGSWFLHTLRYLIGDEAFFTALRRMAYPDPALERVTDGSQTRHATTDDFLRIAEEASGRELDWLFEVYLRQPVLPRVLAEQEGDSMRLSWQVPAGLDFPLPLEVRTGGEVRRLEMGSEPVRVPLGTDGIELDPNRRILMDRPVVPQATGGAPPRR